MGSDPEWKRGNRNAKQESIEGRAIGGTCIPSQKGSTTKIGKLSTMRNFRPTRPLKSTKKQTSDGIVFSDLQQANLTSQDREVITRLEACKDNMCMDRILKQGTLLGSGEFSDAYQISENLILKKNRNKSLHNPKHFKQEFSAISKREMKDEITAYNLLKARYVDILPSVMIEYDFGKDYYMVREMGRIPIIEKQVLFPKWKSGVVKFDEYRKFVEKIYAIAMEVGSFDDILQPALRKDGSLFLTDLGHFRTINEWQMLYHGSDETRDEKIKRSLDNATLRIEHFSEQLEVQPYFPEFVCDFQIRFYEQLVEARKSFPPVRKFYQKDLKKWKDRKTQVY